MSEERIIPPPSGPPAVRATPEDRAAVPRSEAPTSPCGLSFPQPSPQRGSPPAPPHSPEEEMTP
jgi:hypothetical protein